MMLLLALYFAMCNNKHRILLGFKIKSNIIKENVALMDVSIMCFSKTFSEFSAKFNFKFETFEMKAASMKCDC